MLTHGVDKKRNLESTLPMSVETSHCEAVDTLAGQCSWGSAIHAVSVATIPSGVRIIPEIDCR